MSDTFDNENRTRYYGLRKGDTVSVEASLVDGVNLLHAEIIDYTMDNNRVILKFEDGSERPFVAEWCTIISKVEDKKIKQYSDFIGQTISIDISPYQYKNPKEALRACLWIKIKSELTYSNGLLCNFKDVKTTVDNKITVSGVVTECEVDC
jgi:hypothetical protein